MKNNTEMTEWLKSINNDYSSFECEDGILCCECKHCNECPDSDAIREELNPENN